MEDGTRPCPVCGWVVPAEGERPAAWEICPCCGTEFNVDDDQVMVRFGVDEHEAWRQLRQDWVQAGCPWAFGSPPPGWDPLAQLAALEP